MSEPGDHSNDRSSSPDVLSAAQALGERCDWQGAHDLLRAADARGELGPRGLEFLADCVRWLGDADGVVGVLERAHHAYGDDRAGAARTALNLCYTHMDRCRSAQASSWWRRADELVVDLPDCPEHGLHAWFAGRACGDVGDVEGQAQHASRALEIAQRFGDRNVEALARIDLGHVATYHGRSSEALEMLDRATSLALGGEIGLFESGFVFCNAIHASRSRGDWGRAEEWTQSANRWVARVQVSYFPGLCRVHRAEVLRVRGELAAAEVEAVEAERLLSTSIPRWTAMALNELGEVRRRRGDLAGALHAFRRAREFGVDPQPGLALTQLAQGDSKAAHRAIERFFAADMPTLLCTDRANLLLARAIVAITVEQREVAEATVGQLERLAGDDGLPWDRAAFAQAAGQLAAMAGERDEAIRLLDQAKAIWADLDTPFELATCCHLLGRALRADGDDGNAALEFESAMGIFERIGATLWHDRVAAEIGGAVAVKEPVADHTPAAVAAPADEHATMRLEGDYWTLRFDGLDVRVRDGRGASYVAALLGAPGRCLLATDLAHGEAAALVGGGDGGERLDADARRAYRERIAELQADIEAADRDHDLGRAERSRAELSALTAELTAAIGLGGRSRRLDSAAERARQSVTKAIRTLVRKVAASHPALGRYLSNTIRTGTACSFDPDPGRPTQWAVDRPAAG